MAGRSDAIARLGTLGERGRCAVAKVDLESLEQRKRLRRRNFAKLWKLCCQVVDARDGTVCRLCGGPTDRRPALSPERHERAHLIRRRAVSQLRNDPRNVFVAHHRCHRQFDLHQLVIEQACEFRFVLAGVFYINADHPFTVRPR